MHKFTTKITLILSLITISIVKSSQKLVIPNVPNDKQLETIVRDIVQSTKTFDVIVLIRNPGAHENTARVISTVSKALSRSTPTQYMDITQRPASTASLATSRTLIIYIHACHPKLQHESWERIVHDLWSVWHSSYAPNILLLLVEDVPHVKIKDFLVYLWSKKIINVEVFEILPPKAEHQQLAIVAHQYDPFTNEYTEISDVRKSVSWYRDKLKNMNKRPFNIYLRRTEYPAATSNVLHLRLIALLKIEAAMNFEAVWNSGLADADLFFTWYNAVSDLEETIDHVNVLYSSDVCLLTPILPTKILKLWKFIGIIAFGIGIVMLFLIMSTLLVVDRHLRHPMYLMNLLLSFSVSRMPRTLTEKILFLCLVIASGRYTTMFYAELLDLALVNEEIEVNDFNDLENSHLDIVVDKALYPELMNRPDIPDAVKKRMQPTQLVVILDGLYNTARFQNASYFLDRDYCNALATGKSDLTGQSILKSTNLCLTFQNFVFALPKRSPYKERLSDIILRSLSNGHMDNLNYRSPRYFSGLTAQLQRSIPVVKPSFQMPLPFVVLFCGHCLSFFVFLVEILTHKFRNKNVASQSERRK